MSSILLSLTYYFHKNDVMEIEAFAGNTPILASRNG